MDAKSKACKGVIESVHDKINQLKRIGKIPRVIYLGSKERDELNSFFDIEADNDHFYFYFCGLRVFLVESKTHLEIYE